MLAGTIFLLAQDGELWTRRSARELGRLLFTKHGLALDAARLFVHYARPAYRPDDVDHSDLARRALDPVPAASGPSPADR